MKVCIIISICIAAAVCKRRLTLDEEDILDDVSGKSLIGGRPAKHSTVNEYFEFPWMVSLHYQGSFICSSFLVTPMFLMTAAHCVVLNEKEAEDPKDFNAYMGTVNRDGPDNEVTFTEIIVHEEYGPGTEYDIAIMKLSKPVELTYNIQPICLPTKDSVYEDTTAQAMGWGIARKGDNSASKTLQTATEEVPTISKCNSTYNDVYDRATKPLVTRRHICAGGKRDKGVCFGDSGGPLVALNEIKPVAIGIASFVSERGCAVNRVPAVFTAIASYTDWIVEHMGADAKDLCFISKTSKPSRR